MLNLIAATMYLILEKVIKNLFTKYILCSLNKLEKVKMLKHYWTFISFQKINLRHNDQTLLDSH
jgi:hypothetical protein